MTPEEFDKIPNGLYKIFWKQKHGGGTSLAAIGTHANGDRWLALTNWLSPENKVSEFSHQIEKVLCVNPVERHTPIGNGSHEAEKTNFINKFVFGGVVYQILKTESMVKSPLYDDKGQRVGGEETPISRITGTFDVVMLSDGNRRERPTQVGEMPMTQADLCRMISELPGYVAGRNNIVAVVDGQLKCLQTCEDAPPDEPTVLSQEQ